uniref:Uncharacterized protein n=1 Tax=Tanacetum cinerariifolium TaxID=118510 RepID=A0A699GPQ0_TANCI|nr:hypothetical protein [Tanacetum cinerariifolium]
MTVYRLDHISFSVGFLSTHFYVLFVKLLKNIFTIPCFNVPWPSSCSVRFVDGGIRLGKICRQFQIGLPGSLLSVYLISLRRCWKVFSILRGGLFGCFAIVLSLMLRLQDDRLSLMILFPYHSFGVLVDVIGRSFGNIGKSFGFHPFQFSYPPRKLTIEEMLYKFIDEGRREHEEMRAFIREFKTTNEFLLKERNNSISDLKFKVYGLSKAINDAHIQTMKSKDLEASISLMPYTMYEKLGVGEPKPTRNSLELADRIFDCLSRQDMTYVGSRIRHIGN